MKVDLTKKELLVILQLMGNGYSNGEFYDGTGYGGKREDKAAKSAYEKMAVKLGLKETRLS